MVVRSLFLGVLVLTVAAVVASGVAAWVVRGESGGFQAALAAGVFSWFAAMCGLVVFVMLRGWEGDVVASFAPMTIRLLMSIVALVVLQSAPGPLWSAGAGGMMVVNYLVLLVAEISLFVHLTASRHSP